MASVLCLHFNMQEGYILEHTMPSVICIHFSQRLQHRYTPHNTIGHTHAKILLSTLGRQVA